MKVKKAIEIVDANIDFVSLVDKAANGIKFLFAKSEDGDRRFNIQTKIIKADDDTHTVVGVVYEPGVEDAHGDFMKADEIKKAAELFNESGEGIDVQHNEVAITDGVTIVKSWVTDEETTLYGEVIKSGTWMMEIEVTNVEIWKAIEDGSITGLSMGGSGTYIMEDVEAVAKSEKISIFKKMVNTLAKEFGIEPIKKGEVMDRFEDMLKWDSWYSALWALEDTLIKYQNGYYEDGDWISGEWKFETDTSIITEALSDFTVIINAILADPSKLAEMVSSGVSKELITKMEIRKGLEPGSISKGEQEDMKDEDVKKIVKAEVGDAVTEALKKAGLIKAEVPAEETPSPVIKSEEEKIADAVAALMKADGTLPKELTFEEKVAKAYEAAKATITGSNQSDAEILKGKGDETETGYMSIIKSASQA